jgi:heme/copper-type cytochrome/quinol oxidase subunit 1
VAARTETVVPAWQRGRVASWLVTTDHKRIGILYILTSVVFLVLAGAMALVMRLQLAQANADVISADRYNELVTIHGTSMVFLVGVPILAGFGNYLVPLMIGARDVAFPRLNALSYWLFLFGGVVLMLSFFADGGAADTAGRRTRRSRSRPRARGRTCGSSRCTSSPPRPSQERSTSS